MLSCEHCKHKFTGQDDLKYHMENMHTMIGPGYMGWKANDEYEKDSDVMELKKTLVKVIEDYSGIRKEVKKQGEELKVLKNEYKNVLEILKTETYERTKAETMVKVLQETIEAKNELQKQVKDDEVIMDVDEPENEKGVWQKQRSERRKMRKRNRYSTDKEKCSHCEMTFESKASLELHKHEHRSHSCELCHKNFSMASELTKHMKCHEMKPFQGENCDESCREKDDFVDHSKGHITHTQFKCNRCNEMFTHQKNLEEHTKNHTDKISITCNQCKQTFPSQTTMDIHIKTHEMSADKVVHQCYKCNQVYKDMRKLRRHDWRAHRAIECSMCGDTINSRQEMKEHRENKHRMFKKIACKFFPDCFDEDECLYEHINVQTDLPGTGCPKGENCSNQECEFNEIDHKNSRKIMCRFQARCNRGGCQYQHNDKRQAF